MIFKHITATLLFFGMLNTVTSRAQINKPDSIDTFIKNKMEQRHIPAMQLAVVRNGKIVKQSSYGTANLEMNCRPLNY